MASDVGTVVLSLIRSNTKDQTVNVAGIATDLGIKVRLATLEKLGELASMNQGEDDDKPVIYLNRKNDNKQNHTLVALLLAEFIINPSKPRDKGISLEVFDLQNLSEGKQSPRMLLATRLAIPEEIINKLDDINFDLNKYANTTNYLPSFIRQAVKTNNAQFSLDNL